MKDQLSTPYKVLIVEDDEVCRERFERVIHNRQDLILVASVATVLEAKAALTNYHPAIVVVDIGLPDGSGIDVIRKARQQLEQVICLVVTVYGDEQHVFDALAAGASGYLQKDAPLSELGSAIISAIDGGAPVSPSIAKALLKYLSAPQKKFTDTPKDFYLTDRETQVLKLIAKGYLREEIAERLKISLNTVGAHTKNIYRKLEVHSGTGAIDKARNHGLI